MHPSFRMSVKLCLLGLLTLPAGTWRLRAQQNPSLPELWTTLQAKLDSQKLRAGDEIAVRTGQSWVYLTCGLSEGVLLHGRVLSRSDWTANSRTTVLAVRFEAPCSSGIKLPLVLIAVYYALDPEKGQMETYMAMPQGIGPGATGRQSTSIDSLPTPGVDGQQHLPLAKWGEVKRIGHLTLGVGKGADGSTTLICSSKRLRLEQGTRFAFIPVPQKN